MRFTNSWPLSDGASSSSARSRARGSAGSTGSARGERRRAASRPATAQRRLRHADARGARPHRARGARSSRRVPRPSPARARRASGACRPRPVPRRAPPASPPACGPRRRRRPGCARARTARRGCARDRTPSRRARSGRRGSRRGSRYDHLRVVSDREEERLRQLLPTNRSRRPLHQRQLLTGDVTPQRELHLRHRRSSESLAVPRSSRGPRR